MALTLGHGVYAALNESAFNKFIAAYRKARPRYFYYACPPLGTGVFTVIAPLPIPGTNYGMPISLRIISASVDFTPPQSASPLPAPLTLGPNQFAIFVDVEVCFLCGVFVQVVIPNAGREAGGDKREPPPRPTGRVHENCAKLQIWAIGRPVSEVNSTGGHDIGLHIDQLVVRDVGALEALFECYFPIMLNALLDAARYPVERFALGAFATIQLADGPLIADDQIKVWADLF